METVLLVSEQRMKNWTSLDNNIRIDVITPSILNAQETYIQDSLGSAFFKRLKDGVYNNDLTVDEEMFLKDFVGPTLMQYALYMLLPNLKYKFVEKGILNGTSEETQSTTLQELQYLRESTMETAQFYDERLREFLRQHPNMFPLWLTWNNNGMPSNKQTPYFSGIQTNIPNSNGFWECGDCDPAYNS
mgnify:CR=1 FL=1|tara:strand:- start:733 stop:1296 length:564 start_codon:yes stop_codon:yes gene_type:complete